MKFGIYLKDKESRLLLEFMQQNKIKSKSDAVRKCVEIATTKDDSIEALLDISNKLNRLLYTNNLNKKLLEQLFANTGFKDNIDVKNDKCLQEFYSDNKYYNRMIN